VKQEPGNFWAKLIEKCVLREEEYVLYKEEYVLHNVEYVLFFE